MAEERAATWTTTVIMSTSLQGHEVAIVLQNQRHKVRFSDSVEIGSIIFPLSGIAFLFAYAHELCATSGQIFIGRVEKFISVHRNCFLVIAAALHGPIEWNLMFNIQQRLVQSCLTIIKQKNIKAEVFSSENSLSVLALVRKLILVPGVPIRFLGSSLRIIPVHNSADIVKIMLTIAKATCKPFNESIRDRLLIAKTQIVENSTVWKVLDQI